MGFDLYVDRDWNEDYGLSDLPTLVGSLEMYLGRHVLPEIPLLCAMVTSEQGYFQPEAVLAEVGGLKHLLGATRRPYARWPEGRDWCRCAGLRYSPRLVSPDGQIVQAWSRHALMLARPNRLCLVPASLELFCQRDDCDSFEAIEATRFDWRDGHLLADDAAVFGKTARKFSKDKYGFRWAEFQWVTIAECWIEEISALELACQRAVARGKPLYAST